MDELIEQFETLHIESKHNASALTVFISALNSDKCPPDYDVLAQALCSLQNAVDATLEKQEAALNELENLYGLSLHAEP